MRPHELKMKAFGPFAQETTVDFDAMGDNVYLIAGETGSGKTTIFDAIVYALYGTASGSGRSALGTEAFHSDYAKHGGSRDELRVELSFSEGRHRYTVMRRMFWGRKGEAAKAVKEAALTEGETLLAVDKGSEDRNNAVTDRIIEITGMDAGQFRRIVMLAQGEFQRFLQAKSDERGDILGKICDNRRHTDLQLRLKAAKDALREKLDGAAVAAEAQLGLLALPADTPEADRAALRADHPALCGTLAALLDRQEAACVALETAAEALAGQERELSGALVQGRADNGLLDRLDDAREKLESEKKKAGQMEALRETLARAEAAEKVLPVEKAWRGAEKALSDAEAGIAALRDEQARLTAKQERLAAEKAAVDTRCGAELAELREKRDALNKALAFYPELESAQRAQKRCEAALKAAERDALSAQERMTALEQKASALNARLSELDGAGEAAVENAGREMEDWKDRRANLLELQKAIASVVRLAADERALEQKKADAESRALEAEAAHLRLSLAQREGRAGLLAQELICALEAAESAPCPVCGAVHTRSDIPHFAAARGDIPSDEAVKAALDTRSALERTAQELRADLAAKRQERKLRQEAAVNTAQALLALADWAAVEDGRAVSRAIAAAGEALARSEQAHARACRDLDGKRRAEAALLDLTPRLQAAREAAQEAQSARSNAETMLENAKAAVSGWAKKLEGFPADRAAADAEIAGLDRASGERERQKQDAEKRLHDAARALSENAGMRSAAQENRAQRERAREEAGAAYRSALGRRFPTEAAYREALRPGGETLDALRLEAWLGESRGALKAYDDGLIALKGRIAQLETGAEGLRRVDLAALEERLDKRREELKVRREDAGRARRELDTNRKVLGELRRIQREKARYEKAQRELKPLADAANGKTPFSRYVLEDFFREILEQANLHLDTMTGGEYQFVRADSGDGRKLQGLGLRVLNTITNQERDTASLSGGQSFEASLSLALGLSDIVQRQSGSRIRIDSMFIDEGFGSLDSGRLDCALEVLRHLSAGNRQVGIISHVAALEDLPKKLRVIPGPHGSSVRAETDEA